MQTDESFLSDSFLIGKTLIMNTNNVEGSVVAVLIAIWFNRL